MDEQRNSMEDKILACAKELFLKNGYDGTSTTQIAKLAGCNQALIHYYFRSKEKLLETIINQESDVIFKCFSTMPEGCDVREKLCHIIDIHFEFLGNNPELPLFLLTELKNNANLCFNPKGILVGRFSDMLQQLQKEIDSEVAEGKIKDIKAIDLMIDIVSLDVFAFFAAPMMFLLGKSEQEQHDFREKRKEHVKEVITSLIANK